MDILTSLPFIIDANQCMDGVKWWLGITSQSPEELGEVGKGRDESALFLLCVWNFI